MKGKGTIGAATTALDLLVYLTSRPEGRVSRAQAMRELDLSRAELDQAFDMVGGLADRTSGARAFIIEETVAGEETLVLQGDAARLAPLRLSVDEALAMGAALATAHVHGDVRERLERALLPLGVTIPEGSLADTTALGPDYLRIKEAIADGVRCALSYRSDGEELPRKRTIDPGQLLIEGGMTYLIAWDVERDGERRYRMDRVCGIEYTDDSVVHHDWSRETTAESLKSRGKAARLRWEDELEARSCTWAGLDELEHGDDGRIEADVWYTSETWLLDQVIAAGGKIAVLSPDGLRDALARRARELAAG